MVYYTLLENRVELKAYVPWPRLYFDIESSLDADYLISGLNGSDVHARSDELTILCSWRNVPVTYVSGSVIEMRKNFLRARKRWACGVWAGKTP